METVMQTTNICNTYETARRVRGAISLFAGLVTRHTGWDLAAPGEDDGILGVGKRFALGYVRFLGARARTGSWFDCLGGRHEFQTYHEAYTWIQGIINNRTIINVVK